VFGLFATDVLVDPLLQLHTSVFSHRHTQTIISRSLAPLARGHREFYNYCLEDRIKLPRCGRTMLKHWSILATHSGRKKASLFSPRMATLMLLSDLYPNLTSLILVLYRAHGGLYELAEKLSMASNAKS
jgi:hypothetical protein